MRINLTPHQLAAFLAVAHTGSFSSAAQQRGVTQSALSRIVQHIEGQLGQPLFDRTTRRIELTPTGRELMPIAERIVAEFDAGVGELARFIEGQRGRIVIAALPSIAAALVPPTIARFATVAPDVEIGILDGLSGSVLDAVTEGHADIGLTVQPNPRAALTFQPLVRDPLGLVCHRAHPLAGKNPLPWSAFSDHPFIAMANESSVRQITDAAFLQADLAIPQLYDCSFLGTTGHLVAAGIGITALPRLTLPLIGQRKLSWRPLHTPTMQRTIGLVTRTGHTPAPATQMLLRILKDETKNHVYT